MTSTLVIADYAPMNTHSSFNNRNSSLNQTQEKPVEIEYLPRARDIDNPKARGGAIQLTAIAPSHRLDKFLNVDQMVKKSKEMTLEQLLVKLKIEEPVEHDGKRTYCVKSIPKKKILRYLRSLMKVLEIEKFRRRMKQKMKERRRENLHVALPAEWTPIIGQDKIVQIYESERIMKGCIKSVHERIENDSTKYQLSELSELFF